MRKSKSKLFLYHITRSRYWGNTEILFPRQILSSCYREPEIERICVCPDIAGCLTAMIEFYEDLFVYRTLNKVHYYYPYDVFDIKATKEKWLLEKTTFIKVFEMKRDIYHLIPKGSQDYLSQQKRDYERIKKFLIKNNIPLTFDRR